jgi:GNAT superfamily N-acetyltransferase
MERVRRANIKDPHAITRVSRNAYRLLLEMNGRGWVIESKGEILAFVICNRKNANIWALYVDPAHHAKGMGYCLLQKAVDWLWSEGLNLLWLMTDGNGNASGFYERCGWNKTGVCGDGQAIFELQRNKALKPGDYSPSFAIA